MKRFREKRKKKQQGTYTFWEGVLDTVLFIPEIIFWIFRGMWLVFRSIIRALFDSTP
ncbi:hypothetical protein [Bacillus sp. M6-12]|uniref:hypothetical protein n=1 Tax=Bacillus sp. M6-12 TaxID=2054166 RepID=UPI0015E0F23A|nr:hypothetical protein [Bacillus sp. M6-12]